MLIGNGAEPNYVNLMQRRIAQTYQYMLMSLDKCLLN